ncbi:MAG TPA: efflux RND transporter periplasmic adaptor subunit [Acidobacteriota bacterium]|nr:efflux RND transporter periplasmic adaptor subunit [Acidobacteriota bacterium]HNT18089.1 efflux RND transporter periplasmic adaptor subunit [Acidobacteriota bacterium]HPA27208.1 efflux RND transporter periplasmic adaptor subunit [Acidobacteriota bacterium]HQO19426.1 efflux RND transporter periplasmic adaptor subunit [Acidobacteriota bacterium]HQQ46136.1 efflux RND transporter periplasmic adaptor subunit [Acidobacteriota bacterium]
MKKSAALFPLVLLILLALVACGDGKKDGGEKFTCPMHPDVISDRKGSCPVCGMDLVPVRKETEEKESSKYFCPMHPDVVSEKKASCPICGMDLVPAKKEEGGPEPDSRGENAPGKASLKLSEGKRKLLGVTTGKVKKKALSGELRVSARVSFDERRQQVVSTRFSGWVEKLHAGFVGMKVGKGDPLFEIYSEDLYAAQGELLSAEGYAAAVKGAGVSGGEILDAARKKLRLMGVCDEEIDETLRKGEIRRTMTVRSGVLGFIVEKNVVQGQKVEAGSPLMKVVDLSEVWVMADVYEKDASLVSNGMAAKVYLPAYPGRTFDGKVGYIGPMLDPSSRTFSVRVEVPNRDGLLKPEMYGEAVFPAPLGEVLAVPASAVIQTGRSAYAFVVEGERFVPRELSLGRKGGDYYEVTGGLEDGDEIVTSANFLLDSESSLKALVEGRVD